MLQDAPNARDHFQTVVVQDKLYAIGGRLSGGVGTIFKPLIPEVDVYDFNTQSWSSLPANQNLPTPRGAPSVVNFEGKIVVIGGEVETEVIDGNTVSDALAITEQYDPVTQSWERLPDLNFKRHGTQAIVSGPGIFTLAGSPKLGGGAQKNMEYLGEEAPVGVPNTLSVLIAPEEVIFTETGEELIPLELLGGNTGSLIKSIEITGVNASNFNIVSGNLMNAFLLPESLTEITVGYTGLSTGENASLEIMYDNNDKISIALESNVSANLNTKTSDVSDEEFIDAYLYPNPASSNINVRVSKIYKEPESISLFTNSGQFINKYKAKNVKIEEGLYHLDISRLPKGVYVVMITLKNGQKTSLQLIIEN